MCGKLEMLRIINEKWNGRKETVTKSLKPLSNVERNLDLDLDLEEYVARSSWGYSAIIYQSNRGVDNTIDHIP